MKRITISFSIILLSLFASITTTAQTSFDCLGIWAYVTLDPKTTPVIDGHYAIQFPNPPYRITSIDGPGSPTIFNNSYDGYTHVYLRRKIIDIEASTIDNNQLFLEVWVDKRDSFTGSQCFYFVVLCLPEDRDKDI